MQPTLLTERLILRPLTLDDADGIQQQFPHWAVVRYLNALVPWPYPALWEMTREEWLEAHARAR